MVSILNRKINRTLNLILGTILIQLCLLSQVNAAGLGLHAVMANKAIDEIELHSKELSQLIRKHAPLYYRGSLFPDIGHLYKTMDNSQDYTEWTHWTEFLNNYGTKFTKDCSYPWSLACEKLLVFYFGSLAHTVGDTNFDHYFVTEVSRRDFNSDLEQGQTFTDNKMDIMAFVELKDIQDNISFSGNMPDKFLNDIISKKFPEVNQKLLRVHSTGTYALYAGMLLYAPKAYNRMVLENDNWAHKNYMSAKGGVVDTSKVIGKIILETWSHLISSPKRDQFPKICEEGGWPNVEIFLCKN
jgi:hypothetical protein